MADTNTSTASDGGTDKPAETDTVAGGKYDRFQKLDKAEYERVNDLLRDRTTITAREWAIARLCADFRTETGVPMTMLGENLPDLVPFMEDPYSPQAVNQAKKSFDRKVRMAATTFLYGAMSGFYTDDELDDLLFEATETAKFLLEVEGATVDHETELDVEERVVEHMRTIHAASQDLRNDLGEHDERG